MSKVSEQQSKISADKRWVSTGLIVSTLLVLMDLIAVLSSFLLAYYLRAGLTAAFEFFVPLQRGVDFYLSFWPIIFVWPLIFWREGLYPGLWLTADEELKRTIQGSSLASLVVLTLTFFTQTGEIFSRPILVAWWLISLLIIPLNRFGLKYALSFLDLAGPPAILLGTNPLSSSIIDRYRKSSLSPFRTVGVFSENEGRNNEVFRDLPVLGGVEQADSWGETNTVDTVIVCLPTLSGPQLVSIAERLSASFRHVVIIPDLIGLSTAETDVRDMEGLLALEVRRNLLLWHARAIKRGTDLLIAGIASILSLPLLGVICIALLLEGEGAIFFGHERIGYEGKSFIAWKFRTMVSDSDQILESALRQDPELRQEWKHNQKLKKDPRLTFMGRILRRFSLDELPQLWNILKGEMSLVGPRPIVKDEGQKYGAMIELYYKVRPGLTGLWQVSGRSNLDYEERVQLDTYYVRNWSLWLDMVIILRTFLAVLLGKGAY